MSQPPAAGLATAARCLALDALAARTSRLLTGADIPHLLIKGPTTARWLYPDQPSVRPYSDVDILVPVNRFDDAQSALRNNGFVCGQLGFRTGEILWHEITWYAPNGDRLAVDLHRGVAGVGRPVAFFDFAFAAGDSMNVAGTTVTVPSQVTTALILVLHAAHPGPSGKPLVDLRRALDQFDRNVWQQAAELARQCDSEASFRAGLSLLPEGERLADHLSVGGAIPVSEWLAGRQRSQTSLSLALMLAKPSVIDRIMHIFRRLLPSAAFIRLSYPFAGQGFPWLVAGYVRRLASAAWSMPRAVGEVSAARRALRAGDLSTNQANSGRTAVAMDLGMVSTALWSLRTREAARRRLRRSGLSEMHLSAPPSRRPQDRRVVVFLLRASAASCLERSLVLQRFDASTGVARAVVIGVTAPKAGFRAHAWLDGEAHDDAAFTEIVRHETPARWLPAQKAGPDGPAADCRGWQTR